MLDIQYTERKGVRLTITPNRITIKFPKGSTEEMVKLYTGYVEDISNKFKPKYSFRGEFKEKQDTIKITLGGYEEVDGFEKFNFIFKK